MDIKIEKKPWYIRYRYYMIAALAFIIFLIYVISLSLGPRKLRIETDNIQIAEVKDDVSIRPRACFSPSYNKVKSQTKHVWLLTLL